MNNIHKGGRPEKYTDSFYLGILEEYETNSYSMLQKKHKVSRGTILRWLTKGRELKNEKQQG